MNYWVTTQWPHSTEKPIGQEHSGIFLPNGRETAVNDMSIGDIVFIYESKHGRTSIFEQEDGTIKKNYCRTGKMEIRDIVEVTRTIYEWIDSEPENYTDGTNIWWRYRGDTKRINTEGFISLLRLNEILGYSENYTLRGFGDQHSGIKKITKKQALALIDEYNSNKK